MNSNQCYRTIPPGLFMCEGCGAVVASMNIHDQWHTVTPPKQLAPYQPDGATEDDDTSAPTGEQA